MPKKRILSFLCFLSLAVSACLSPVEGKKSIPGANLDWRGARLILKRTSNKKHPLILLSSAAYAGERLAAADRPTPTRRRLADDNGFSLHFVMTSHSGRPHLLDAALLYAAFILENDRALRAAGSQIAIQAVYQPLAVAMPNLRSPPRATPS